MLAFLLSRSANRSHVQRVSIATPADPDPETEDNEELADDSDHDAEMTEEADRIIPYLEEPNYAPFVALEYPNTEEDTVSAYAKIAGRTWTYYVRSSSINIGRAPEKELPHGPDGFTPINGAKASPDHPEEAHIDLGPSKLVSRLHATVLYHEEDWHVEVKGRNGVRVNNQLLKRSQKRPLTSGDVLEIAGTEMIFVTPSAPVKVHEVYLSRMEAARSRAGNNKPLPAAAKGRARRGTYDRSSAQPQSAELPAPTHISPYAPPGTVPPSTPGQQPKQERPTTPVQGHSLLSAPYLSQNAGVGASYEHHMTIENNDQVDYASDAFKDVKPPMSYATLIAQAILSTQEGKLSLSGIYDWIQGNFAYYRHNDGGWQVS